MSKRRQKGAHIDGTMSFFKHKSMATDTTSIGMQIQIRAGQMARTNRLDGHNRTSGHNRHTSLGHVLASRSVRSQGCVVVMAGTSVTIRITGCINSRRIATTIATAILAQSVHMVTLFGVHGLIIFKRVVAVGHTACRAVVKRFTFSTTAAALTVTTAATTTATSSAANTAACRSRRNVTNLGLVLFVNKLTQILTVASKSFFNAVVAQTVAIADSRDGALMRFKNLRTLAASVNGSPN
jgi:hypothetical protein